MTSLTIELPDDTYRQLRELAEVRGISLNVLIQELSAVALAAHATESRFRAVASKGDLARAREILDRLDQSRRPSSDITAAS